MSQVRTNSIVPAGGIPGGASGGGIIQCVSTTKTDIFSSTTTMTLRAFLFQLRLEVQAIKF